MGGVEADRSRGGASSASGATSERSHAHSLRKGATSSVTQVSTAVRRRHQGSGSGSEGQRSGMIPL